MASIMSKLARFARSPQGREMTRKATEKAQQFADRPENRKKVEDLRRRFTGRGGRAS